MYKNLKTPIAAVALLLTGGSGLAVVVGMPAQNAAKQLEELEKAQRTDDAERAARKNVVSARTEQIETGDDRKEPDAAAEDGGTEQAEHLQEVGGIPEDDGTAHIANWIAISSLRSAMALYFVSFLLGIVTIIGLLASLLSVLYSRRALNSAASASRARVGIRITGSSGAIAEFDVFPATERPLWLNSVCNRDGVSLRDPGMAGQIHMTSGDDEKARGDVTSATRGEGVVIDYEDVDGTPRRTTFALRKIGANWCVVERQD